MSAALVQREVSTYRGQKLRERAERRDRANARARTTVDRAKLGDPLLRRPSSRQRALGVALAWATASVALHGAVTLAAVFSEKNSLAPRRGYDQPVVIQIVEPPPIPALPPPEALPDPSREAPPPLKAPVVEKLVPKEAPPPDPIDPLPPPPEPPHEPQRRVVGINMESTVTAGTGPAFAAGNTRMGETAAVAQDPMTIGRLAPTYTPPKRTFAPPPAYPPHLRAQGIEGDVGLRVEIDAAGHVVGVAVTAPSAHDELDRAATDAAKQSTYEPAKINGVAAPHGIEFTVRFRLHP